MKVVIDTNVLFSIIVFPSPRLSNLYEYLEQNHETVIFDYVVDELIEVTSRKRPQSMVTLSAFIETIDIRKTTDDDRVEAITIRDAKDQPILDAALAIDADVILTGDRDFTSLKLDRPRIMTPAEFIAEFL